MSFNKRAGILMLLLCIFLRISSCAVIRKSCDYLLRKDRCYKILPFCKTWTYVEEENFKGTYLFKCEICETGFEPIEKGVGRLTLSEGEDIPDPYAMNMDSVQLCRRVETDNVFCAHPTCKKELPFCRKYNVKNIQEGTVAVKGIKTIADFECTECEPLFEPYPKNRILKNATLSPLIPKLLCSRKEETRECGNQCEIEFPGCKKYSVSNVQRSVISGEQIEFAMFRCLQALPGYEISMNMVRATTNPSVQKNIALKQYETEVIKCDDIKCRHILPDCKEWSAINYNQDSSEFSCEKCREGYQPRSPVRSYDYFSHWFYSKNLQVCEIKEVQGAVCGEECQEELPGCLKYTVWSVSSNLDGTQRAKYSCDQCKDGFLRLEDTNPVVVQSTWEISDRTKVRCYPKPTPDPTLVEGSLKDILPNCRLYSSKYDPQISYDYLLYECSECYAEFEPSPLQEIFEWYSRDERPVCRRIRREETYGVPCDQNCQKTFPGCGKIKIMDDYSGRKAYHCTQCLDGWFQIPYETPFKGLLSNPSSPLIMSRKIRLCAQSPSILYIDREECLPGGNYIDSVRCSMYKNCRTILTVSDFETAEVYDVCDECHQGFTLKMKKPHPYDDDQTLCEPVNKKMEIIQE